MSNLKKCKVCREWFDPDPIGAKVCSEFCAMTYAASARGKAEKVKAVKERKADKVQRDKLKSRATWAREAQTAFNAFIRERDADLPCISCGRHHGGQYHAGHYLSVGARPELRFETMNVHKQCAPCNTHLSGNAVLFRKALIEKIGIGMVEFLEGPHELRRDSIDDLKFIKAHYSRMTRQLKEANA